MTSTIGIPIKLLNEATGHQVTVEIDSGQTYRGKLIEVEDNMNCQLENINVTQRDGRVTHLDRVYIRGSHVRLFIVPDMLRNAPMFRARGVKGRAHEEGEVEMATSTRNVNEQTFYGNALKEANERASGARRLTSTAPDPHENGSTAGLSHEYDIQTAYYKAKVPIWIDEIPNVEAWKTEFLKPEAKEVVEAVGAWLYIFRQPRVETINSEVEETMKAVQEVVERHAGYGADTVMLAVAMPNSTASNAHANRDLEEWDDVSMQYGFEYIDYSAQGKNEFGEKVGLERLKEALEANEWTDAGLSDEDDLDLGYMGLEDDDNTNSFALDEAEMTAELFGMKAALNGDDFEPEADDFIPPSQQKKDVDDLDRMMGTLLAIKEQSADMPEAQKKRMAAKAVRELLSEEKNI
ncbi:hypothetical protein LTR37_018597 [Vermiconidia calcicola]|uniref:Uncharacterized protein n=1 Tax=Vermiconidia calcicola TaxID=1690605 RepID=A0ACC3MGH7_9PEZI|nr:hypothetical protein LTR37_018597 [Vermiconidia calcicola]